MKEDTRPGLLHRSRIDIMASILGEAGAGIRKTHIMYRCNLSFKQLHAYLDFLVERGLLKVIRPGNGNGFDMYETTKRGRDFIQAYGTLRGLLHQR